MLQYADDLLLYTSDKSISVTENTLISALVNLSKWVSAHGMDLSPSKSALVVFTRKRTIPPTSICYNATPIPVVQSTKFLGLTLDSKPSWNSHIECVIARCQKNLNILRAVSGVWWGSHPTTLKLIYNALVRSRLDYESFLLDPLSKSNISKLNLIQSQALRIVAGAMKSSPINVLQV